MASGPGCPLAPAQCDGRDGPEVDYFGFDSNGERSELAFERVEPLGISLRLRQQKKEADEFFALLCRYFGPWLILDANPLDLRLCTFEPCESQPTTTTILLVEHIKSLKWNSIETSSVGWRSLCPMILVNVQNAGLDLCEGCTEQFWASCRHFCFKQKETMTCSALEAMCERQAPVDTEALRERALLFLRVSHAMMGSPECVLLRPDRTHDLSAAVLWLLEERAMLLRAVR